VFDHRPRNLDRFELGLTPVDQVADEDDLPLFRVPVDAVAVAYPSCFSSVVSLSAQPCTSPTMSYPVTGPVCHWVGVRLGTVRVAHEVGSATPMEC
jgi:hypothetical protein